jgi:hypothetical protein
MARMRRAGDWKRDLAASRQVEASVAAQLRASPLVVDLEDHTSEFERLDFSFRFAGERVWLDVKEKRQPYSAGIRELWPGRDPEGLFILDETVYRRIVWQGGGGYLAVHDLPGSRWAFFGPWELTLGPKVRYNRWIEKSPGNRLRKGKILIDLTTAPRLAEMFSVQALGEVIEASRAARGQLAAYELPGVGLPEIGRG